MTEKDNQPNRCPCCGGHAAVQSKEHGEYDRDGNYEEHTIWRVSCLACGLRTAWAFDRDSVVRRWNVRAEV